MTDFIEITSLISRLQKQANLLTQIRLFFSQRQVLEAITPVLGRATGTDPALAPFKTRYHGPGYADGLPLYLQTSPELHMKRLLVAGSGSIFQISSAFRDGEFGSKHNPEFSLLEWYRPGFDHHQLIDEVAELVCCCLEVDLPIQKISYQQLFRRYFSLDPLIVSQAELKNVALNSGISRADELELDSKDAWLDLLLTHVIEPQLGQGALSFIYDYPATQAALARLNPNEPQLASRFELYYQGVELANGFHELTDAAEQRMRFEQDNIYRRNHGLDELSIDEQFITALEAPGMPDCSGVALGLDRLLMLKLGAGSLQEVMNFPLDSA